MNLKVDTILTLLYAVITPIIAIVMLYPYIKEGEELYGVAALVTIISLLIVPPTFFIQRIQNKKSLERELEYKTRSANANILEELKRHLEAFDYDYYPNDQLSFMFDEKSQRVSIRFLNTSMYESLLYSDKISLLDKELRKMIQDIYSIIKVRNYYLKYAAQINDRDSPHSKVLALRYYALVNRFDKELENKIKQAIEKIKLDLLTQ